MLYLVNLFVIKYNEISPWSEVTALECPRTVIGTKQAAQLSLLRLGILS